MVKNPALIGTRGRLSSAIRYVLFAVGWAKVCGSAGDDAQQLDVEGERRIGPDTTRKTLRPIGERRRHDQPALAADTHAAHALVPSFNDAAGAELKAERLAAVARAVELGAVLPPTREMHHRPLSLARLGTGADH